MYFSYIDLLFFSTITSSFWHTMNMQWYIYIILHVNKDCVQRQPEVAR